MFSSIRLEDVYIRDLKKKKQGNSTSCLLCIGLLQQRHPKGREGVAPWEAQGGIDAWKPVVNDHLCPAPVLPKTELEGAPVPAVTPLRLVWRQHLQRVEAHVSASVRKCSQTTRCPTLFRRCLFLSKKEHAQRNQQSPNRPCFAWAKVRSSGKRAGDWHISCKRDTREEDVNSKKRCGSGKNMGSEMLSKIYLSNYFSHADTRVSCQISYADIKICTRDGKFPLWLNGSPVMQVSWPQAR